MRINIDSDFFGDERIEYLAQAIGENRLTTDGRLLRIWHSCYRDRSALRTVEEVHRAACWVDPNRSLVPLLVQANLAEAAAEGVRIRGVEDRIEYLIKAAAHGKRSAAARKRQHGTAQPTRCERAKKQVFGLPKVPSGSLEGLPKVPSRGLEPLIKKRTSSERPPAVLDIKASNFSVKNGSKSGPAGVQRRGGQEVVATYVDAFRQRYKTSPAIDGACRGEVKRLLDGVGAERACLLVQAYLQLDDPKYLAKCHDLTSLRMDLQRVSVALDQGRANPNTKDWRTLVEEET